jgi:hypothetical protein
MANRSLEKQSVHDSVVRASAETYSGKGTVYTNPNGQMKYEIHGHYPDIIVLKSDGSGGTIIEEIETEETVNEQERDNQWKPYASLGYTFKLIVPKNKVQDAQELVKELNVDQVQSYTIQNGRIYF